MVMPAWLPHTVNVNGQWDKILAMLYHIFETDFLINQPDFEGREVWIDDRKLDGVYEEGFWHLITKGNTEIGDRLFDIPRAERLPWCAPTIDNSTDSGVRVWDYREGSGRLRTYLWLVNWDYVVILEKRHKRKGEIAHLITAYHVGGASTRKSLQRKYEERAN
jgi:hypothetical protein